MHKAPDPLIQTVVAGRYRIIKPLGEGGMGVVYLAEHVAIQKAIALKVLRAQYAHKGDIVTRFQQEAISASRIKHPNVLDVFDFGQIENGCFYLAMEYLEGNDLADELERRRIVEPGRGIRIGLQVCRALSAAHAKGVVHRDLKPENVFLQRTGDGEEIVKIVDFGIAHLRSKEDAEAETKQRRLTRTGMIFGTPEYMSPEQAGGKKADERADVYAVGIIMYEMFTGAVPFTGDSFLGVLSKHLSDPAPAMSTVFPELQITPELQSVIMRALEKEPGKRYQSMLEFAQAIQRTPEGLHAGNNASIATLGEPSASFVAAGGGSPTAPQFGVAPSTPAMTAASGTPHAVRSDPRAETVPGTETIPGATTKSKAGLLLGVVAAFVMLAGIVAALVISRKQGAAEPAVAKETRPHAPASTPAAIPSAAPKAAETQEKPAALTPSANLPSGVRLNVVTQPAGATVLKNGFQVCDTTPCEVLATPNETLEIVAKKGALSGKAKVLAQRDQSVDIKLVGAAKPATRMCEVTQGDLKILRPCN
jgi:serine/threonine-protein kinase